MEVIILRELTFCRDMIYTLRELSRRYMVFNKNLTLLNTTLEIIKLLL